MRNGQNRNIVPFCLSAFAMLAGGVDATVTTFVHDGHGYAIYSDADSATWMAADANVATISGGSGGIPAGWADPHLVYIESAAENAAILNQLSTTIGTTGSAAADGGGATYAWIGAEETVEGTFEWGDGTDFWTGGTNGNAVGGSYTNFGSYQNFGPGGGFVNEPDNFTDFGLAPNGQDRIGISTEGWGGPGTAAGEWNDIDGGNDLAYIVEFDTIPVPEPSAALLFGVGCFLSALRRRRKT